VSLALVSVLAVLAEDEKPHIVVVPVAKQGESANRDLDALQTLEPADEEEQALRAVADLAPGLCAVDGLEHREVDAWRDDEDALGVRSVLVDKVRAFLLRGRDQNVGLLRDLAFDSDPQRRLRSRALREAAVLDQAESMGDVRPASRQARSKDARDLAREPVVREKQVVDSPLVLGEAGDPPRKRRHLVEERVLVQTPSGRKIDDAREVGEAFDRRVVG